MSRAVLAGSAFRPSAMADGYRELSERLGHDFGPTIALMERLPPFMHGEDHARMRMTMARLNERGKASQLAAAEVFLADLGKDRIRPGHTLDLMHDLAVPLFRAMSRAAMEDQDLPPAAFDLLERFPSLFSTKTPLRQRLEINAVLASVAAGLNQVALDYMALLVLGIYPFTGSLAMSLHGMIAGNPLARLRDLPWPDDLPVSALSYVDRVCLESAEIAGQAFTAGERVRCLIRSSRWSEQQNVSLTFGTGSHLCLGRPISLLVWRLVGKMLACCDCRAEAAELIFDKRAEPFDRPAQAPVAFHP